MPQPDPPDLQLEPTIRSRLEHHALTLHRTAGSILHDAVEQYLEREERGSDDRQRALSAWHQFEADGLHATADEVDAWLARLEAGENARPPECHG